MAATNPIRVTYPASATGAQTALSIDWRDQVPSGYSYEVQFNAGASGSVTIETTLDDINDSSITPDWVAETAAITADSRGVIGHPVVATRLNISSLAGGTLTFKLLGGSVIGDASGVITPGGGAGADVNVAEWGGTATTLGQKAMAASVPVVIASDQSAVPVSGGVLYGAAFPTLGMPAGFISALGSTLQPAVVSLDGSLRSSLYEVGDVPLVLDNAATGGSSFPVPVGGVFVTTLPTYANEDRVQAQFTNRGELFVTSSGATTTDRLPSSAATTNPTVSKASAGRLFNLIGYNTNAAVRYLKLYNKATAPTVGTDTPVLTIPLVPSAGFAVDFANSLLFPLGIGYALTTGAADGDTGAVGAGDIVGLNVVFA